MRIRDFFHPRRVQQFEDNIDQIKKDMAERESNLKEWAAIREIVEYHYVETWPHGDIIIRLKRKKLEALPDDAHIGEACEVFVEKPTKES